MQSIASTKPCIPRRTNFVIKHCIIYPSVGHIKSHHRCRNLYKISKHVWLILSSSHMQNLTQYTREATTNCTYFSQCLMFVLLIQMVHIPLCILSMHDVLTHKTVTNLVKKRMYRSCRRMSHRRYRIT